MRALLALVAAAALAGASCGRRDAPGAGDRRISRTATGVEMVLVPGGEFRRGSSRGKEDERPVQAVRIASFWMDRHEVTQGEYEKLGFPNPSRFKGPDLPVEMMTWTKAALFANARSRAEGLKPCYDEDTAACDFSASGYRLPTEAEWEHACRAGAETEYSFGSDPRALPDHGWFADNASKRTHPVGKKRPNAWGLRDLHGNVAEWCNDIYDAGYYARSPREDPRGPADGARYAVRGGSWRSPAGECRAAARAGENPGFADACLAPDTLGFRLVRRAEGDGAGSGAPPGSGEKPASGKADASAGAQGPTGPGEPAAKDPAPKDPAAKAGKEGTSMKTGFILRDAFLEHRTGETFPERPERLRAIDRRLRESGLLASLETIEAKADPAAWIARIHSPAYIERVRKACEACGEGIVHLDSPDVPVSAGSYRAATAAAAAVLDAADAVMAGRVRNCFCAVRPPGHHALRERAMGFCLFNNVAIAARYLREKHGVPRVLIVDWDVHHGNGTQAAFYSDPSVFYFSVHRSPFYPGTGSEGERGEGAGVGTTLNVPLPAGSGDADMERAFAEKLEPAAAAFRPGFVLVSAGFDAHERDPLGGQKVTTGEYARLTRAVKAIADRWCGGRMVSVLEGGYDLEALADCAEAHLRALME